MSLKDCQSKNHKRHRGELWKCSRCKKSYCYEEGADDDEPELCDDCYEIVNKAKEDFKNSAKELGFRKVSNLLIVVFGDDNIELIKLLQEKYN